MDANENHLSDINLSQDIQTLFRDYFKSKNGGQEANEELIDLFNEILNPS
jgi:exonuclease SbcD